VKVEETSQVRYGRTTIHYGIRRSARRKTVAVAVDPLEGVLLTAPPGVARERLDRVVHDKAPWILERLRRLDEHEVAVAPRQWVSGESFAYLGRHYRLRVRVQAKPEAAKLERGWLVVGVGEGLGGPTRAAAVHEAVCAWYRGHAGSRLRARASWWAERGGIELGGVVVRDQQKRWGSCDDKGVLRFNWRIIQAPMRLVDYVVAHEVVHVIHRDHTTAFWARLGVLMPDYDRRKDELRRLGGRLDW
jgi:predicted metal-dependent hydrolase